LGYKPYQTSDSVIGIDYSTFFSFHQDIDELNVQSHRGSIYGEKLTQVGDKSISLLLDYSYEVVMINGSPANDLFSQKHLVLTGLSFNWNEITSTKLLYGLSYYDFENFPERDAFKNAFSFAQQFSLYRGRLLLTPGFIFAINRADDIEGARNYDYYSPGGYLEVLTTLRHGISIYTRFHYFYEDYNNDLFNRKDNQFGVKAVISKRLYKHLFLDLGYQYINNDSDSDISGPEPFEYNRNIFTTALSIRF